MSARTNSAISYGVQGAGIGSAFGPLGAVIGGVGGTVLGLFAGGQQDAINRSQVAWSRYNSLMQHSTNLRNIQYSSSLAMFNAVMAKRTAQIQAQAAMQAANYNAAIIKQTVEYNNRLLEQQLVRIAEQEGLDLQQLAQMRARERGTILARQSASGTVMNQDTNAEVIVNQQTQEALDAAIIAHGADIRAADIENRMAQSLWEGNIAISQTIWQGKLAAFDAQSSAQASIASSFANTALSGLAGISSSNQQLQAGLTGIAQGQNAFNLQQTNDLISGLFAGAGTFGSIYYRNKLPKTTTKDSVSASGFFTDLRTSPNLLGSTSSMGQFTRTGAGTSLLVN